MNLKTIHLLLRNWLNLSKVLLNLSNLTEKPLYNTIKMLKIIELLPDIKDNIIKLTSLENEKDKLNLINEILSVGDNIDFNMKYRGIK